MSVLQLLIVSAVLFGSYCVVGECQDLEFDALVLRYEGQVWKKLCDTCVCQKGKIICSGGPKCTIPYKPHSMTCLKWTPDKCCCLKEGCRGRLNHLEYKLGDWVPQDANGCEFCQCAPYGRGICRLLAHTRCIGGN